MTRRRWLTVVLGAFATILTVGAYAATHFYDGGRRYYVDRLRIDDQRSVLITTATWWEASQPVFYDVYRNGAVVRKTFALGYTTEGAGSLTFELVSTPDLDFVAVVEKANPDVVLMFHDFTSDWDWPQDGPKSDFRIPGNRELHYERMDQSLDRLRECYRDRRFVLSRQVSGQRTLRIRG